MKQSDLLHDLRAIDELVILSGEKMQAKEDSAFWPLLYRLSVAVWHLLQAEIRRTDAG